MIVCRRICTSLGLSEFTRWLVMTWARALAGYFVRLIHISLCIIAFTMAYLRSDLWWISMHIHVGNAVVPYTVGFIATLDPESAISLSGETGTMYMRSTTTIVGLLMAPSQSLGYQEIPRDLYMYLCVYAYVRLYVRAYSYLRAYCCNVTIYRMWTMLSLLWCSLRLHSSGKISMNGSHSFIFIPPRTTLSLYKAPWSLSEKVVGHHSIEPNNSLLNGGSAN